MSMNLVSIWSRQREDAPAAPDAVELIPIRVRRPIVKENTMASSAAEPVLPVGFDFTSPEVMVKGLPIEEFARLRRTEPVWWNAQDPDNAGGFHDGGYWVISKHKHIREISRDPDTWSSQDKGCVMRYDNAVSTEEFELTKVMMHNADAPAHTRLRKLISRGFTPRALQSLEDRLTRAAHDIVRAAAAKGAGDFVRDVSHRLPLLAIAELLGFPTQDHERLFEWTNAVMTAEDPDSPYDARKSLAELLAYAYQLAEQRIAEPAEDIITKLVHADLDGDRLSEIEFGYFVLVLVVAGNETTRNATSLGMSALLDNPDQWELYRARRPATAADEVIRWATPVNAFQRTARRDTDIDGVPVKAGERVGLFYGSANYDEDVFNDPFAFNILRDPNPHLAFGGTGPHYCIGANLARMEVNIMLNAIADHLPNIRKTANPTRVRSGWINGIATMPVDYGTSNV
jgi:cholest-4-en-3-one 26-monooxygenase